MSAALENLYSDLAGLQLYSLHRDSLVDKELAVYGAAFAVVEDALARAAQDAFVQTAGGAALARYEELVGLTPREGLDEAARRQLVLYRLGAAAFDFHYDGMVNSIRATGMEAEIGENPQQESITVRLLRVVDPSLDLDGMKESVRAVLPAHLEAEFEMGELTWDLFDGGEIDWRRWDGTGMTWADFDLNGHALLGLGE